MLGFLKLLFGAPVTAIANTVQTSMVTKATIKQADLDAQYKIKKAELQKDLLLKKASAENIRKLEEAKVDATIEAYKASLLLEREGQAQVNSSERVMMFLNGTKDEAFVYMWVFIILYSMIPGCSQYVEAGALALHAMPDYVVLWGTSMVSAIFGVNKLLDVVQTIRGKK